MISRILVGIDGSKQSFIAGDYGIWLSKVLKRPVIGIHIVDIRLIEGAYFEDIAGALGFTTFSDLVPKVKEALDEKGKAILNVFAKKCREKGADCSIAQAYGIVHKELVDMSDPEDIIIIGKTGHHSHLELIVLGSTAEAITKNSKCPVLIVNKEFKEIKNICLAFDGREKSIYALSYINKFAKYLSIDKIEILHIKNEIPIEKIKSIISDISKIDYKLTVLEGYPEQKIKEYVNKNDIDMLAIGAYGENKLKEFVLGSTTSYIINNSGKPVLVVK